MNDLRSAVSRVPIEVEPKLFAKSLRMSFIDAASSVDCRSSAGWPACWLTGNFEQGSQLPQKIFTLVPAIPSKLSTNKSTFKEPVLYFRRCNIIMNLLEAFKTAGKIETSNIVSKPRDIFDGPRHRGGQERWIFLYLPSQDLESLTD